MAKTSIQLESDTLHKLKNLKIAKLETYDEIINRLISNNQTKSRQEVKK